MSNWQWGGSAIPLLIAPRQLKIFLGLTLHGVSDWVQVGMMKGKVSSAVGIYWPIIPQRGDREVCLITCWGRWQ